MQDISRFQNAVQKELAWRKLEISNLRGLALKAVDTDAHVFRAGQVLLCAHWEGFLKRGATLYLEHAYAQDISLRQFLPCLIAAVHFKSIGNAAISKFPGSAGNFVRLIDEFLASIDIRPMQGASWQVDTEGNPGTECLERILKSIGIDSRLGMDEVAWSVTRVFVNDQLVRDRHSVAHGNGLPIKKPEFLERADRLLKLLDRLSDQLLEAATNRVYLVKVV